MLLTEVDAGNRQPTLRFWEWEDKATVIGSFQSYVNELRPEGVERHGIDVVRRISGGGAMFMEGGNCVTYSMYVPDTLIAGLDYAESYAFLDRWVIAALAKEGVDAGTSRSTTSPPPAARSAGPPSGASPRERCCTTRR